MVSDWRTELREASRVFWYERWRTNRLNRNGQLVQKQPTYGGRMGPGDGRRTRSVSHFSSRTYPILRGLWAFS